MRDPTYDPEDHSLTPLDSDQVFYVNNDSVSVALHCYGDTLTRDYTGDTDPSTPGYIPFCSDSVEEVVIEVTNTENDEFDVSDILLCREGCLPFTSSQI